MDVFLKYVGWKSHAVAGRYVAQTASANTAGSKRVRDAAFMEADNQPLAKEFRDSHAAVRATHYVRTEGSLGTRGRATLRHDRREQVDANRYGCDLVPQQGGLVDPKLHVNKIKLTSECYDSILALFRRRCARTSRLCPNPAQPRDAVSYPCPTVVPRAFGERIGCTSSLQREPLEL